MEKMRASDNTITITEEFYEENEKRRGRKKEGDEKKNGT